MPDNSIQTLNRLNDYLRIFEEKARQLNQEIGRLEKVEIPPFKIPEWPPEAGTVNLKLAGKFRWRVVLIPEPGQQTNLANLDKQICTGLEVTIRSNGSFYIKYHQLFDYDILADSTSEESNQRLICFVLFHQCLNKICRGVIKVLKYRLKMMAIEIAEYQRMVSAVKKSFEPLIPFLVADKLADS